jgi:hypothetical protein
MGDLLATTMTSDTHRSEVPRVTRDVEPSALADLLEHMPSS